VQLDLGDGGATQGLDAAKLGGVVMKNRSTLLCRVLVLDER